MPLNFCQEPFLFSVLSVLIFSKMLYSTQKPPAIAKGLCIFGIILCILILFKQITGVSLLQTLRASMTPAGGAFPLQKRLELSEQLWEDSVTKRHEMWQSFIDPLKPMYV